MHRIKLDLKLGECGLEERPNMDRRVSKPSAGQSGPEPPGSTGLQEERCSAELTLLLLEDKSQLGLGIETHSMIHDDLQRSSQHG
jgi:hypothetical protein